MSLGKSESHLSTILIDVVDIIFRNVSEDITRQDIYIELLSVFDDESVLATALGIDPMYDTAYKDAFNDAFTDNFEDEEE